jgi:transcriptional regulator with XRE-family HTH domain
MDALLRVLAQNIRSRRQRLGITQEKLAELASLHRTYVGAVERGERNISLKSLAKIASALQTEPSELLAKQRGVR